jgi:thymidylate synthase (FAD)
MKAEYIDHLGTDLTVVNAARVSMDKESLAFTYRKDVPKGSDEGLLSYLAIENHWTPYSHVRETFAFLKSSIRVNLTVDCANSMVMEGTSSDLIKVRHSIWGWAALIRAGCLKTNIAEHVAITLGKRYPESWKAMGMATPDAVDRDAIVRHIPTKDETDPRFIDVTMRETVPIFVARQRFKHMVGFTYNEVSRRYVDTPPEFYKPDVWRSRPEGSIKQGSGNEAVTHIDEGFYGESGEPIGYTYDDVIEHCTIIYNNMLKAGVAPEQARMVLPQSMYTSYYVTGSLSAWARAYKQRIDKHAQVEIQDLAVQWDTTIRPLFPESWAVLTEG